jgi:predicted Zn-dependent peptidase
MPRRALRLLAVSAVLVALTGCSVGAYSAPPGLVEQGPSREVLSNGLRLIIKEHRGSEVAALQLWVGVGGRDEAPPERGFAHFIEHLLFKGTETRVGHVFAERYVRAVEAVSAEDVRRVAGVYLAAPTIVRLEQPPSR